MSDLWIHGMGHFHPDNQLTNQFFEELDIGTSNEWIVQRTGIKSRSTVLPLDYIRQTRNRDPRGAIEAAELSNAQTGARAARIALERANVLPEQIGLVIAGSCSPDWAIPAEACCIAAELGIEAPAYDLNSACSTFGVQLHTVAQGGAALPEFVLIVQPENNTRVIDYNDRGSAVLWGDGTAAAVVSTHHPGRVVVSHTRIGSDPAGWASVRIPRLGHFAQHGSAVQRFAIKRTMKLMTGLLDDAGGRPIGFVGHQANALMLEAVVQRLGSTAGVHYSNVRERGNTGSAGAPSVVSERWDRWEPGDRLAMAVVGSGLTWAGLVMTFA